MLASAVNIYREPFAQGVHHRHAHAMQAAGNLVAFMVELASGMERRHDHVEGIAARLMRPHRYPAAVIFYRNAAIIMNAKTDGVAIAGHRLVDTVVNHLGHEMLEALDVGAADVHIGTLSHRLEAFEDLDVAGPVIRLAFGLGSLGGLSGFFR